MAYLSRGPKTYALMMIPITKEEEDNLDKKESFTKEINDKLIPLGPSNVKYYGEIDFNQNSEDYAILEDSRMFFSMEFQGVSIPANYDYEHHCCYSEDKRPKWFDTVNAALICQYTHGILGKPKRVAIVEV